MQHIFWLLVQSLHQTTVCCTLLMVAAVLPFTIIGILLIVLLTSPKSASSRTFCAFVRQTIAAATSPSQSAFLQVQALTDVNQRLQSSLADTTKAHQAERLKRDNLHKQVMHQCSHRIQLEACMRIAFTLCSGRNTPKISIGDCLSAAMTTTS